MTTAGKTRGSLRRFLIVALLANVSLMTEASATPSSYDALDDFAVTFTLPAGVTLGGASAGTTTQTQSGDGRISSVLSLNVSPPGLGISLHAFGTGTGSSVLGAFVSLDLVGPSTTYMIVVDFTTFTQTVAAFAAPGGSAMAFAEEIFGIAGATEVDCLTGAPSHELCYDAQGTVTARLEGLVSGSAVTPAPEPATLALLSLGLAGLGFSRRKQ